MRTKKSVRDARRGVLAVVLVLLSLAAHSAAAGSLPTLSAVLAGTAVAGAIAWAVLGQRRSFTSLAVILFAGQLLMHAVTVAVGHHGVSYLPDQRMLIAHLLAAVIVAGIFAHGEHIVETWIRAACRLLGVVSLPALEFTRPRLARLDYRLSSIASIAGNPCLRRGPPLALGGTTFA